MREIIQNLKNKEILYSKSIEALKMYITEKYPRETEAYRARVFADAVYKIIDSNIKEFGDKNKGIIKASLIKTIAEQENLDINAYDIMKVCVSLELDEKTFTENLLDWVNNQQNVSIEEEAFIEMTNRIKEEISETIEEIIAVEEAVMKETKEMEEEPEVKIVEAEVDELEVIGSNVGQRDIDNYQKNIVVEDNSLELELVAQLKAAFDSENDKNLGVENIESAYFNNEIRGSNTQYEEAVDINNEVLDEAKRSIYELKDTTETSGGEEAIEVEQDIRPIIYVKRDRQIDILEEEERSADRLSRMGDTTIKRPLNQRLSIKNIRVIIAIAVSIILVTVIIVSILFGISLKNRAESLSEPTTINAGKVRMQNALFESDLESVKIDTILQENRESDILHEELKFKVIDEEALKEWFIGRKVLIGERQYFDVIIEVAEEYGVNPLLLFAIAGQEQGFVPIENTKADKIINNPYNVFVSWEEYNTNIDETTRIAARTILTLSEDRPEEADPIEWINRKYAEDENWHVGVSMILKQLEGVAGGNE